MKIFLILPAVALLLLSACGNSSEEPPAITQQAKVELSQTEKDSVISIGKEIAQHSFKILGGNLKKAMAEGGIDHAVNYCNANASHLMDSLGTHYSANIKRTSNKLRNPKNTSTTAEKMVINNYLNGTKKGPVVNILPNGNKIFYAAIKMKPLCVSCHGTVGETVSKKNYQNISNLYPNDKAIGYKEGDFRGIWSIELQK